jgi:outer membrane protein OmpA-like peptidoglycan-associated protein
MAAAETKFPELDQMGISYGMRDGNMVISIPSSITFPSGQATLSSEGHKALKQVASTLKKQYPGAKYEIEGHTDADPIKKSKFTSNRELSIARAMAVLTYLVEDCAIKDETVRRRGVRAVRPGREERQRQGQGEEQARRDRRSQVAETTARSNPPRRRSKPARGAGFASPNDGAEAGDWLPCSVLVGPGRRELAPFLGSLPGTPSRRPAAAKPPVRRDGGGRSASSTSAFARGASPRPRASSRTADPLLLGQGTWA